MDLAGAYRSCAVVTKREARNFYYAFLSLPARQRRAVYALYAFCRDADNVADGDAPSGASPSLRENSRALPRSDVVRGSEASIDDRRVGLARLRERLANAAEGRPEDGPDLALADTIATYGVDSNDLVDVLEGMEIDLSLTRVESFEELRSYCYHVASAVGLATLPILNDGVPPTDAMRDAAVDLGLGMQLVNVLRDVAEDLDRDRIYLPREEMASFGVDEVNLRSGWMTDEMKMLFSFQAARASEILDRGRRLIPLLPRRGRRCPWLLAEIYGRILDRIRAVDNNVLRERVALTRHEKVGLLLSSRWRRL